jgi:alpha-galactosidase
MTPAALAIWVRHVATGAGANALGAAGLPGWLSTDLPFSFHVGGRSSHEFLFAWQRANEVLIEADDRVRAVVVLTDPETGLEVRWEATTHPETLAVEWLVSFRNTRQATAPVLEKLLSLDLMVATDYHDLVVYHATGGIAASDAFEPQQTVLPRNQMSRAPGATGKGGDTEFRLAPAGGRSSNGVLPYFNVEAAWDIWRGLVVGIGWSGQWEATVSRFASAPAAPTQPDLRGPNPSVGAFRSLDRLRLTAGIAGVRLALQPGEEIRTARILLIPWTGDRQAGQNQLRRHLYRQAPMRRGQPPLPALFSNLGIVEPGTGALGMCSSFDELASLGARLGVEDIVLDAGWYSRRPDPDVAADRAWVAAVGNYGVRDDVFPNGLRPLAEHVRRLGAGFGLWFEPERVAHGTRTFLEHRDWLFHTPLRHGYVFNLGNPAARAWLTDLISGLIDELGIAWYRHDANADYLPVWRAEDPADRQGISEMRYIEGLYQFWSDLLARHPELHIDGCASGGRRMDFVALRHHHGQTHTDWLWGDPGAMQAIMHGGNQWLPSIYFNNWMGTQSAPTADTPEVRSNFFSALGGGMNLGWRMLNTRTTVDVDLGRRWLGEFGDLRNLVLGDMYPLLPHTLSEGAWLVSQYDRPEVGQGMIVAFRRRWCAGASVSVQPRGLDPRETYRLIFASGRPEQSVRGSELLAGLTIEVADAPGHEVIRYVGPGVPFQHVQQEESS